MTENNLMVRYKKIEHERFDAPFIGALISSVDCHINCPGCFNQHLKKEPTIIKTAKEIIDIVKSNPFNEGVILGGLEWSEQKRELILLVDEALKNNLKVCIYSGLTKEKFFEKIPILASYPICFKFGFYDKNGKTTYQEGVSLASDNQYFFIN